MSDVRIALLRGINVGGANRLAMSELRRIAELCGFGHVRTYIQSGNVVLRHPDGTDRIAATLEEAIAEETGLTPAVLVRTLDEFAEVAESNPFLERSADLAHHHVVFTEVDADLGSIVLEEYTPETAAALGRHLYLYLPAGIGRSRLAGDLAKRVDPRATTRNWRTVCEVLTMAREAASEV